ncbi:hypothetical protein LTR84_008445 [Exophiala bonariae]|uniref:FAD-binding FR-type domain-containing protein n=1 Tax=Exophiala bonariae TaxID=1690606 RepID=A0AAV9MZY6_9EURO|nr:hypothetical protein LTR84_008445 [Exophiala bonariae]
MALFRASPTLARCSSQSPFFLNPPVTTPTSTFIGRTRPSGANRIRHKHSDLEREMFSNDSRKMPLPLRKMFYITVGATVGMMAYQTVSLSIGSDGFMECELVAKESVSPTASIFYLDPDPNRLKHPNRLQELMAADGFLLDYPKMAMRTNNARKLRDAWNEGTLWSLEFKQPQLQIVRHYTPLPPSAVDNEERKGCVKFLIREEDRGEMSSYLHNLKVSRSDPTPGEQMLSALKAIVTLSPPPKPVPVGKKTDRTTVDVRGPNHDFRPGKDVRQIVYFAGGTGIAPALQTAHALLGNHKVNRAVDPTDLATRKLHILWANRTRSDCLGGQSDPAPELPRVLQEPRPQSQRGGFWSKLGFTTEPTNVPVEPTSAPTPPSSTIAATADTSKHTNRIVRELEALKDKYPGQVTVEYFVDGENTWIDKNTVSKALGRLKDGEIRDIQNSVSPGQRQVMVSGPPGFIAYLAGPKVWIDGWEQQGPLGGLIARELSSAPQNAKVVKI